MRVVNLRKEAYTHYGGRPGQGQRGLLLGNPFIVGTHGPRGICRELFGVWLRESLSPRAEAYRQRARMLPPDAVLGCFCGAGKCHLDHVVEWYIRGCKEPEFASLPHRPPMEP